MSMRSRIIGAVVLCAILAAPSAYAADAKGCDFLWPLKTEMAWMQAAGAEKVASGATLAALPDAGAIELALKPAADVTFPLTPTKTPKAGDAKTFSGFVGITDVEGAHVQVTISAHAWIDVIQNGKPLEATAHTGSENCPEIRKSVRFEVGSGPLILQISGSEKDVIRIAVRPAAD
jgi:hypothetical protein